MKRTMHAAGMALAISAGTAFAADIQRPGYYAPAPAPVAPIAYNWVGPYVGVNLGYQWGEVSGVPTEPSGMLGGVQGGYNWQSGQFVFGGEADIQITGAEDTAAPFKFSNPWWGSLRGRGGVAWNSFLFYATAGLAFGEVEGQVGGLTESKTQLGWTAGLGTEVALNPRWSAKVEYLYIDLGDRTFTVTGGSNGFSTNLLRLGVNYRF
jgi:outer membrane immunogenic protein